VYCFPLACVRRPLAWRALFLVSILTHSGVGLRGDAATKYFTYESSITSEADDPINLKAAVAYPDTLVAGSKAPVAVVMHGYSPTTGNIPQYLTVAERHAQQGIVSIVVAMRGRDGSEGTRDSGGLEIYDIFDAVEHIKADPFFADKIDPNNLYISGYSGGGGNAMSALTKFPDYFNLGAAFFGMSDYGYDKDTGWAFNGANHGALRTPILNRDIGYRPSDDPDVIDRYHARASNLASKNNPYSEIHLFVNQDEPICPPINDTKFRDNAVASESYPGEFDNINVHVGQSDNSYWVDWNGNSVKETAEVQNWPHGLSADIQDRGEAWYLDRLLAGDVPSPVLNPQDELFVAGWVRTKPFQFWLGDGQNAAGELDYSLGTSEMSFQLAVASNEKSVTGELTIYDSSLSSSVAIVELNGTTIGRVDLSNGYKYFGLADGDRLRFVSTPEPATCRLMYFGVAVCFGNARRSFSRRSFRKRVAKRCPSMEHAHRS
jgi:dienelactone hydrolase